MNDLNGIDLIDIVDLLVVLPLDVVNPEITKVTKNAEKSDLYQKWKSSPLKTEATVAKKVSE